MRRYNAIYSLYSMRRYNSIYSYSIYSPLPDDKQTRRVAQRIHRMPSMQAKNLGDRLF